MIIVGECDDYHVHCKKKKVSCEFATPAKANRWPCLGSDLFISKGFFLSFFKFIWFTFVRWYFVLVTPGNSVRQIWKHTKFHRKWFVTMRLVARTIVLYVKHLIRFLCAFVWLHSFASIFVAIFFCFFCFFDFIHLLNRFVRRHRFSIDCTKMAYHRCCISNMAQHMCAVSSFINKRRYINHADHWAKSDLNWSQSTHFNIIIIIIEVEE